MYYTLILLQADEGKYNKNNDNRPNYNYRFKFEHFI